MSLGFTIPAVTELMSGRGHRLGQVRIFSMKDASMNSMKRYFAVIIPSAFISLSVGATEVYYGSLKAPND